MRASAACMDLPQWSYDAIPPALHAAEALALPLSHLFKAALYATSDGPGWLPHSAPIAVRIDAECGKIQVQTPRQGTQRQQYDVTLACGPTRLNVLSVRRQSAALLCSHQIVSKAAAYTVAGACSSAVHG